jgi:creatinine amidohydrolase/Fe(II)-dependent formamide hydrolase-like protein
MKRILVFAVLIIAASAIAFGQKNKVGMRGNDEPQRSNIYRIEELTAPQIDALDRDKTLFILPIGMLEQHGPHLPIGSDSFGVSYSVSEISKRVGKPLPGWNIVIMPAINYGEGGANEIGNIQVHPGTYGIRQSTLRSIVADVGGQLAQNRFKWIFVIHGHGAPTHNLAISEACDFISETFKITMLNLMSMAMADEAMAAKAQQIAAKYYSPAELASFGVDIHAGLSETSGVLAIQRGLVNGVYKTLPSRTGRSFDELRQIALSPGWQGYFSSPAKAKTLYGKEDNEAWVEGLSNFIVRAVHGENLFSHPRYPDQLLKDPAIIQINKDALANEKAFEMKLEQWLERRKQK